MIPYDLPRSESSLAFLVAMSTSPLSIAEVACGQRSRGEICSPRAPTAPTQTDTKTDIAMRFTAYSLREPRNNTPGRRLIQMLFVRWTNASFNSPRCVLRKSSSSGLKFPAVFSLSIVRISIICRAALTSTVGFA